ncbi:hypothetical protein KAM469_09700 [Aeromonas caviae]|nr:hypothetical protein KAM462_05110 [Aeromonas caviae]GKR09425.1 hypothetical protein KAM465_10020 [Aeromonas caviae]GKR13565.1 hypothetical protein KAM466_08830 [Aeromonas caviae]GKR17755.1 hypothetical protein KAM467_07990 [Aeromonas caviae]GKR26511.1 hypothetical protein KAM469_09700 [Aeromonas caviae]
MALESTRQALMEARATQRTNCPPSRSICQQSKPPMKGISKIQSKVTISALIYVLVGQALSLPHNIGLMDQPSSSRARIRAAPIPMEAAYQRNLPETVQASS